MDDLQKRLETHLRKRPAVGQAVYIARGAVVVGDVTLGDHASVWYNAVLRGDLNRIVVGRYTNIQDNAVLHLADEYACVLGDYITVGHSAVVHACAVEDQVLIGMGATILDGAVVGAQCIVGAGALVTQRQRIPAGSLVLGNPAKVTRPLTAAERAGLKPWAEKYAELAAYHLANHIGVGTPLAS
jgi:carbonic anhydrase/acetyltransferase-like protein (isoleucine patch superfamily)